MIPKYAPGEKIPGTPYIVSYTIGRGGGGSVLAVKDEHLDVMRAVKLLEVEPKAGERREDAVKNLLKEAVLVAKLHKLCREHIVEVLFVGTTTDQHTVPYIVMELIDGAPLRDLLKRRGGRLEPVHARQVGIDVLAALAAAHDQGVVHRDLKPANIMCEVLDQNRVRMKVIDFGIAGGVNQRTKRIAGTFRYAAPEQIHIQGPSPLMAQTDLYSLGCILYECLAGQGPFDAHCKTNEQYVTAHLTHEPPPISSLLPGIPRAFDAFFASILAKDPARRPASARACAALLMDLPWGQQGDVDVTKTEEMLEAAIQSVVANHGNRRPTLAMNRDLAAQRRNAPTPLEGNRHAMGGTLQSPGAQPAPIGAPSTLPQDAGRGGTMRVSQIPDTPVMPGAPPHANETPITRTSVPHTKPVVRTDTAPIPTPQMPGAMSPDERAFWGTAPTVPADLDGRDPSTFGAVARTSKVSPSARWFAIAAGAVSAAILFVALGIWIARRQTASELAAAAAAGSVTQAPLPTATIAPSADPLAEASATAAPIASTSAPPTGAITAPATGNAAVAAAATGAVTGSGTGSAAGSETAAATPAATSTSEPLAKTTTPAHAHATTAPSTRSTENSSTSDTTTTAKPRKLPGSGL